MIRRHGRRTPSINAKFSPESDFDEIDGDVLVMEEEPPLPLGCKAVVEVGAISEDEDEDEEVEDDDGDSYSGGEDIEIAPGDENPVVIGTEDRGREETRGGLNRSGILLKSILCKSF
ncbi:hypothetical protein U1Q18_017126 [Sarracenia purpurea var. burkii]